MTILNRAGMLSVFDAEERQHSPSVFQVAASAPGRRVVDFCYLSNKFFPVPAMMARLVKDFEAALRSYPSMQPEQCELAGALTGYAPGQILVGNGASELIHLVTAQLGQRWLLPYPSYMEYENVIRDFGKDIHLYNLCEDESFRVNPDRLLREVERYHVDAVVLPNPNSPTGQKMPMADLLVVLNQGRHLTTIVVDESFIEFTAVPRAQIPTLQAHLDEFPNLIIMRSLGKDFGVCGLRLGLMASSNAALLNTIRRYLPIWNISPLAEAFLRLCVEHRSDYEAARITCIEETRRLAESLRAVPQIKVFDTFSNFLLFKILDAGATSIALRDALLTERGLYVRDCSRKLGLGDKFIRVGTNLPADNRRLVDAVQQFFPAGR